MSLKQTWQQFFPQMTAAIDLILFLDLDTSSLPIGSESSEVPPLRHLFTHRQLNTKTFIVAGNKITVVEKCFMEAWLNV